MQKLLKKELRVGAYTAKAARNINGTTLHRLFKLKVDKNDKRKLGAKALDEMRRMHEGVNYYILDEVSMIGCTSLAMINQRLAEIRKELESQFFGGANLILVGDWVDNLFPLSFYSNILSKNQLGDFFQVSIKSLIVTFNYCIASSCYGQTSIQYYQIHWNN